MGANFALAVGTAGILLTLVRLILDVSDVVPVRTYQTFGCWRVFGAISAAVLATAVICKVF